MGNEEEEENKTREERRKRKQKNFLDLRMWLVSPSFGIRHCHCPSRPTFLSETPRMSTQKMMKMWE